MEKLLSYAKVLLVVSFWLVLFVGTIVTAVTAGYLVFSALKETGHAAAAPFLGLSAAIFVLVVGDRTRGSYLHELLNKLFQ